MRLRIGVVATGGRALTAQETGATLHRYPRESGMELQPIHPARGHALQAATGRALQEVGSNACAPRVVVVRSLDAGEQAQHLRQWTRRTFS